MKDEMVRGWRAWTIEACKIDTGPEMALRILPLC